MMIYIMIAASFTTSSTNDAGSKIVWSVTCDTSEFGVVSPNFLDHACRETFYWLKSVFTIGTSK